MGALYWVVQWTWGLPQTLLGCLVRALAAAGVFGARSGGSGGSYHGAVVTRWPLQSALSLGMFLFVPQRCGGDLVVHEYGHSVQSLILGPLYLPVIGLPSLVWCAFPACRRHRERRGKSYYALYTEKWANHLGEMITGQRAPAA